VPRERRTECRRLSFADARVHGKMPPMAGYSGTPLPKKLGIKSGHTVVLLGAPDGFEDTLALGDGVRVFRQLRLAPVDVVIFFVDRLNELERRFADVVARMHPAGAFWVAWPKKASRRASDITEDVVRRIGLAGGLVDNKVCAIDEVWSGLRLVVRVEDREALAYRAAPAAPAPTQRPPSSVIIDRTINFLMLFRL
jgi:hypothetical protein